MGKSNKIETSYNFTAAKAAAYLRNLADQLDQGRIDVEQAEIDLSDHVEVKESIKRKPDKGSIKIKVKLSTLQPEPAPESEPIESEQTDEEKTDREGDKEAPEQGPEEPPADGAARTPDGDPDPKSDPQPKLVMEPKRPSYKKLKKSMSQNYTAIKAALRQGISPDQTLIEEFDGQCRQMATYPDKGEPYYGDFIEAADRLAAAFAGNDLPGMDAAIQEMGRLRKNCHRRFK